MKISPDRKGFIDVLCKGGDGFSFILEMQRAAIGIIGYILLRNSGELECKPDHTVRCVALD